MNMTDWEKYKAEQYNKTAGSMTDYDCPKCMNRGDFMVVDDNGYRSIVECSCMELRRNMNRMKNSGLSDMMERYTFDTFQVKTKTHARMKRMAQDYVENPEGWLLASGTPGTGKTHICTAVCCELMKRGLPVRYAMWRDISVRAKANVNSEEEYNKILDPLKTVKCLYIDDLFKVGKGMEPTVGDTNLAFELLNYRYNDSSLLTIISTEKTADELIAIDEAVGSRIYERSKEHYISTRGEKNWRIT